MGVSSTLGSSAYLANASSFSSMPNPGPSGTVRYPDISSSGSFSRSDLGGSDSPVYSCSAKLGMHASSWMQAAVDTGDRGLCGITFTCCASAIADTFLQPVSPPHRHRSGLM